MIGNPRFSSSLLGAAALTAMLSVSIAAWAKLSRAGDASTGFKAAGPAGLTIDGKTSDMTIADDGTTVTITVPLSNLTTGIGLRDDHMKKALETGAYPTTTLTVARAALKIPASGDASGDAPGQLTLHGTTKPVTVHYTASKSGDTLNVKGSMTVNVDDYGIKRPSYLGVTVKPEVDINTAFQAKDN